MLIFGLVLIAVMLTAAAWVLRPAPAHGATGPSWTDRFDDLLGHLRHRNGNGNGSRRNGNGNGHRTQTLGELAAPRVDGASSYLDGFDLRSVAQVGVRFFGSLAAAVFVAGAVVWLFAALVGVVGDLESLMRDIGFAGFKFISIEVIVGFALLAMACAAVGVVLTVLAAALYNVLARRSGGVRIYTSTSQPTSQAPKRVKRSSAKLEELAPPPRQPVRRAS